MSAGHVLIQGDILLPLFHCKCAPLVAPFARFRFGWEPGLVLRTPQARREPRPPTRFGLELGARNRSRKKTRINPAGVRLERVPGGDKAERVR